MLRSERWGIATPSRELVAPVRAAFVIESEDWRWVYYSKQLAPEGLFRVARSGGRPEQVVRKLRRRASFAVRGEVVFYVAPEPRLGVYRRDVSTMDWPK